MFQVALTTLQIKQISAYTSLTWNHEYIVKTICTHFLISASLPLATTLLVTSLEISYVHRVQHRSTHCPHCFYSCRLEQSVCCTVQITLLKQQADRRLSINVSI